MATPGTDTLPFNISTAALPGKAWFHVTIGTYASWLSGDARGFRERDHRIHSSGDHRHRPPEGEHAGLHRYAQSISGTTTIIPRELRPIIGRKVVSHLQKLGHRVLVVSVGGMHVHAHVELPLAWGAADHELGRVKQAAALLVRGKLDAKKLWTEKCGVKPIKNAGHQHRTYGYIRGHMDEGAWVWAVLEGEVGIKGG